MRGGGALMSSGSGLLVIPKVRTRAHTVMHLLSFMASVFKKIIAPRYMVMYIKASTNKV